MKYHFPHPDVAVINIYSQPLWEYNIGAVYCLWRKQREAILILNMIGYCPAYGIIHFGPFLSVEVAGLRFMLIGVLEFVIASKCGGKSTNYNIRVGWAFQSWQLVTICILRRKWRLLLVWTMIALLSFVMAQVMTDITRIRVSFFEISDNGMKVCI